MSGDKEQFNISMPPDVWGPIFWNTMHIVSLGYPVAPTEAEKSGAKAFFESLAVVLPCPICREHYAQLLKDSAANGSLEEAVQSKGQLIYWVWDIHNKVNTMLEKPTMELDAFLDRMKRLGSESGISGTHGISIRDVGIGAVVGIVAGGAAYWAYNKYVAK
jgi:hypothetical protein